MIKNKNYDVKNDLSVVDKINMTIYISNGYFVDGQYTPYYADINRVVAFFTYCVDGIEFDSDDDIFSIVAEDNDLKDLFTYGWSDQSPIANQIVAVLEDVDDIVEFEKQKLIFNSSPIVTKLEEILQKESRNKDEELMLTKKLEKLTESQNRQMERNEELSALLTKEEEAELLKKFTDGSFDAEGIAKAISDQYFESKLNDDKSQELLNLKNDQIKNQAEQIETLTSKLRIIEGGKK